MGSCISKFKPMNKPRLDLNFVQDKVVISHPPLTSPPLSLSNNIISPYPPSPLSLSNKISPYPSSPLSLSNKISPYPPSPSASSSSVSSLTCVSSNTTLSSISSASSILISKNRLFSDEFLSSRYKENPHVVRINSLKANTFHRNSPEKTPEKTVFPAVRRPSPQRVSKSTPQKRFRSASPAPAKNLIRQKSFRTLRSPSPSRNFNGDQRTAMKERKDSKRNIAGLKAITESGFVSSSLKKETCIHRIRSRINETAVENAISNDDDFDTVMEDIDNPLISLDCFIFL